MEQFYHFTFRVDVTVEGLTEEEARERIVKLADFLAGESDEKPPIDGFVIGEQAVEQYPVYEWK